MSQVLGYCGICGLKVTDDQEWYSGSYASTPSDVTHKQCVKDREANCQHVWQHHYPAWGGRPWYTCDKCGAQVEMSDEDYADD